MCIHIQPLLLNAEPLVTTDRSVLFFMVFAVISNALSTAAHVKHLGKSRHLLR